MKKSTCLMLLVPALSLLLIGCTDHAKTFNRDVEIQNIAKVIDSCIGWFKTKDFELSFSTVAQDSNFLEVHPEGKVVRGFEQFKKNSEIFKNPEFHYVRHEIKDLKITLEKIST